MKVEEYLISPEEEKIFTEKMPYKVKIIRNRVKFIPFLWEPYIIFDTGEAFDNLPPSLQDSLKETFGLFLRLFSIQLLRGTYIFLSTEDERALKAIDDGLKVMEMKLKELKKEKEEFSAY